LLALPMESPPERGAVSCTLRAAGGGAMTGPAPVYSPGPRGLVPVQCRPCRRGSGRRQGGVSQAGALTWPGRLTFRAGAVIVDVLVDDVPGGVEQVYELEREQIARGLGWGVHLGQLLSSAWYLLCPLCRATVRFSTHHACALRPSRLRS